MIGAKSLADKRPGKQKKSNPKASVDYKKRP